MAELSNGARWQDNVDNTLTRLLEHSEKTGETVAGISLQVAVIREELKALGSLDRRVGALEENDRKQDRILDRAKWGFALVAAFGAALWDVAKTWIQKQFT